MLYAHNTGPIQNKRVESAKKELQDEQKLKLNLFEVLRKAQPDYEFSTLAQFLQPKNQDLTDVFDRIKTDLTEILHDRFYDFEIFVYGSAISGLAFRGKYDFFHLEIE